MTIAEQLYELPDEYAATPRRLLRSDLRKAAETLTPGPSGIQRI